MVWGMEVHFIKMEVGLTYRRLFINEQSDEYRKKKKKLWNVDQRKIGCIMQTFLRCWIAFEIFYCYSV